MVAASQHCHGEIEEHGERGNGSGLPALPQVIREYGYGSGDGCGLLA